MTTPHPHAHAESVDTGCTTELWKRAATTWLRRRAALMERETVGPAAIRYPAAMGVDPREGH
jgi:hypothetical protein